MKIKLPITALAALLGFALASAPLALTAQTTTTATTNPSPAKPEKAKASKFSGTLTAIDAASFTITDKTLAPRTFAIAATTKLKKDGKTATTADFKVGDKVGGSYTTDASGTLTATTLVEGKTKDKKPKAGTSTTTTPAAPAPAAQ